MSNAVVGALRVIFGADTAAFERGADAVERRMKRTQKDLAKLGDQFTSAGKRMTLGLTTPVVGLGVAVVKMAGDFETAMNMVAVSTGATSRQLSNMRELALQIGADTSKSASEAAAAMDILGKAGMRAEDILAGGARAAVDLAIATGSDLDPAAAAIAVTMAQFKREAADLPAIVNNITGAVNESIYDFRDFQQGMAQAGGVAANAGVPLEEFTAVLAGTATQFSSGADAGTSFKTFLTSMVPTSKAAAEAIAQYGLAFFDAGGKMKSVSDIANMLQEQLGGLSTEERINALKTIFGQDAYRTAVGLMELAGGKFEEMQARIAATDATSQAAARMEGFNGKLEEMMGALETLAIRIADSGLLDTITAIIVKLGEWVDWLGKASPETLKWGTVIAAVVAAIGPLLLGVGMMVSGLGALLPIFTAIVAGISTVVTVIVSGAIPALASLIVALGPILLPLAAVTAAIVGVYLAWKNWDTIAPILRNLYVQVRTWIVDRLGAVWNWLSDKITAVKGWFFGLYDAVVGHSYIPDMVDGIGVHMARLDGLMVRPAQDATAKTAAEFQTLAAIMARLFPKESRANQLLADLAALDTATAKARFTTEQLAEARRRLNEEYLTDAMGARTTAKDVVPTAGDFDFSQAGRAMEEWARDQGDRFNVLRSANDNLAESYAEMARDVASSLQGLVNNIKSGDWLSALASVADIAAQVLGALNGNTGGAGRSYSLPSFGGARAMGGPVVPSRSYLVGERGPELFVPRGAGDIVSNDNMRGGSRVEIIPSPYFDVRVDGRVQQAAPGIARMGSVGAQRAIGQRQNRRLA